MNKKSIINIVIFRVSISFLLSFNIFFASYAAETKTIQVDEDPLRWTISTQNASYQIILTQDQNITPGYFGPSAGSRLYESPDWRVRKEVGTILREIPYRGGFVDMTPALEVIFPDGNRELELVYEKYFLGEADCYPFLQLDMKDIYYPIKISQFIRVIPELDIFEKWLKIYNWGENDILLENFYSGSILLPQDEYDLIQFSGDWGREFFLRRSSLTSGLKSIFSRGVRTHQHTPFFMVRPTGELDEYSGTVWFGSVIWNGNWRIDFDVNRMERTQITGGINNWDTHWNLQGKSSFETPKMLYGLSNNGSNGVRKRMHHYTLYHILPKPFNQTLSKVLYNSWYATTFDVNEKDQVALAKIAKEVGVELFVIDDGWFKGRKNDRGGLGDWTADEDKFPNGLSPMINRINDLGLDFGIWVEPEMVNPNSNLYREHPDWALYTPNRTAHEGRHQLVLNFAKADVKNYTMQWMDELLSKYNIKFIKWDMNRYISEAGWPEVDSKTQRELRIRYINNLYEVLSTLREKHPKVVFECCSGGGGRANLGILQYTDQIWTSDNTDPGDRLMIQHGFSFCFPAKTMVNWVTDHEWHNKETSLKFRFHVAMAGNLGIGNDLFAWSEEEKKIAKEMIALYKSVRHIIQFGLQYRLLSPFTGHQSAVQFVTQDGSESVIFVYQTLEAGLPGPKNSPITHRLVLNGLDAAGSYLIEGNLLENEVSGKVLMSSGISVPLRGNYTSKIIVLRKK
jgi:alpha-galactosidase